MARRSRRAPLNQSGGPEMREIVPHPRYGTESIPSGHDVPEEEVRASFWGYGDATLFPASAIPANIERQNFAIFPRRFYVDLLKTCRDCNRAFIFFAREQQHWYEELGFYVDADCIRCPACRKSDQALRRRVRRYGEAKPRKDLDDAELATMVDDAVVLWTEEILRNEQELRRLRNVALRRIPAAKATQKIEKLVAALGDPPSRAPRRT